uniref:Uncharacterized protein n=1 Tax=Ditylenchus dipsaci TaxID=166011 RepID=A0A915E5J3_9BILA
MPSSRVATVSLSRPLNSPTTPQTTITVQGKLAYWLTDLPFSPEKLEWERNRKLQRADSLANNRRRAASQSSLTGRVEEDRAYPFCIVEPCLEMVLRRDDPTTQQRKFSSACNIKHTPQNGTVIVERQPILSGHRKDENGMPRPDSVRSLSDRRSTKADIEQLKSILEEEEEKPREKRREQEVVSTNFFSCYFLDRSISYLMVWWANTIGETLGFPQK